MGIDQSRKSTIGSQPLFSQHQQIPILTEQRPAKLSRPGKQFVIIQLGRSILVCCDYVNATPLEPFRNGGVYVMVHIQPQAQGN